MKLQIYKLRGLQIYNLRVDRNKKARLATIVFRQLPSGQGYNLLFHILCYSSYRKKLGLNSPLISYMDFVMTRAHIVISSPCSYGHSISPITICVDHTDNLCGYFLPISELFILRRGPFLPPSPALSCGHPSLCS